MLTKKKLISAGIFTVFTVALLMTGIRDNKANSMNSVIQAEAISVADSVISFFCVKDDDLIEVSMAQSKARKRDGRWYLPGYSQCF